MLNLESMTADQSRRLTELSVGFHPKFLEILEEINRVNNGSLPWQLSSLASRDTYRSPLYERCCKLILAAEALGEGERRIVTKDKSLAKVIRRLCVSRKISAEVRCRQSWGGLFWNRLRPWALLSSFMFQLARRCCGRRTVELPKESVVLLDVFVASDSETGAVTKNGDYLDLFYRGWRERLTADECRQVFYLPVLHGFEDEAEGFNQLRECGDAFLIPDDYLIWHDYLWMIGQVLRMGSLKLPDCLVAGVSIGPLLRDERRTRFSDWSGIVGLLSHRFAKRSAEAGLVVKRLVDWSENQAVDRGLVLGFHSYHSETQVIAYKGYPMSEAYLPHLCPSISELKAQVHPNEIWVIGTSYAKQILSITPEAKVCTGPALRYASVFNRPSNYSNRAGLLVGLTIEAKECKNILALLSEVTPCIAGRLPIKIKPHPRMARENLRQMCAPNHADWNWVNGTLSEYLKDARLFCTNASSTALEALAAGVPVLLIGNRQSVTWNPIPKSIPDEVWELCFSAEEFLKGIEKLIQLSPDIMENVSRKIRDECFTKPDDNNVRALLGLNDIREN